jgi:hypothetical protein
MDEELLQADRVLGTAAQVEGAPLNGRNVFPGAGIGVHGVGDVEHIPDLATVPINGNRLFV